MARRRSPAAPGLSIFLFPLPALVVFVIFFAAPTLQAFQYAVTDWDGYSADFRNVGLGNLTRALTGDSLFTNAAVNNAKFLLVVVVVQTVVSLLLALALLRNSRGSIALRALFFFPTILSSVSVAFIWKFIYDPTFGIGNSVLGAGASVLNAVGIDVDPVRLSYLGDDATAIYWVAFAQCWAHTGQMMVVYVAGLQAIPGELYEAASMDGASPFSRFRFITWPLVAPATGIVVAYTTIQSFKAFDLILGLSGIPPKGSLDILSTRIYTTFANSQYGYAAAQSILFMALIGMVTVLQRRALRLIPQVEQ
ncbi:MAG TPA: sugar ABC transporter permease [Propionibacteriaceae bacterium]|nr:sugar ABC transporter permease [Propionibacteriaceae bacterium]